MQRIFTPYRSRCSLQEMDKKEGDPVVYMESRQQKEIKTGKVLEPERKQCLALTLLSVRCPFYFSSPFKYKQNTNRPFFVVHIKSNLALVKGVCQTNKKVC